MTYRTEIENLLIDLRKEANRVTIAADTDESVYPEIDAVVRKTVDGFFAVLNATKAVREAQKAYFKARRTNAPNAGQLLDESKQAEKILDDLVKFWSGEMAPPAAQATLFN